MRSWWAQALELNRTGVGLSEEALTLLLGPLQLFYTESARRQSTREWERDCLFYLLSGSPDMPSQLYPAPTQKYITVSSEGWLMQGGYLDLSDFFVLAKPRLPVFWLRLALLLQTRTMVYPPTDTQSWAGRLLQAMGEEGLTHFPAPLWEELYVLAGQPASDVVREWLLHPSNTWSSWEANAPRRIPGMADCVLRHAAIARILLDQCEAAQQVKIIEWLHLLGLPPAAFSQTLQRLATTAAKGPALAARAWLDAAEPAPRPPADLTPLPAQLFPEWERCLKGQGNAQETFRQLQDLVDLAQGRGVAEWRGCDWGGLLALVRQPAFKLVHVVRMAHLLGQMPSRWPGLLGHFAELLGSHREAHPFTLEDLAQTLESLGADGGMVGRTYLQQSYFLKGLNFTAPEWARYFAPRPQLLEEALGLRALFQQVPWLSSKVLAETAFRVLAQISPVPPSLEEGLWSIALGNSDTFRRDAQRVLERTDFHEQLLRELTNSRQEARRSAAAWLARLRLAEALPALQQALRKEKSEVVQGALIGALEALGAPVEALVDRPALLAKAKLARPAELQWFPWALLPALHWRDGQPLENRLVDYLLITAHKGKNPEPSGLLRLYCSLLAEGDRMALGALVLRAWIGEDSQSGSAIAHKGLLAVAGACCHSSAVALVEAYLKEYYGYRAAQCRALLQMLSWVDQPESVGLLLSVARGFRTKGIREEADRQVELLAERKGWTREQLADRTVAWAGLDERGRLPLDFGRRQLTGLLDANLKPGLLDENGKWLKAFPEARKDDDADLVAAAKKEWSAFRKEATTVLKQQQERLYEAMCWQRRWTVQEWQTYVQAHPLVGPLCQRLIWLAQQEGRQQSFRPTEDYTLCDHDSSEVKLSPEWTVQLAHPLLLGLHLTGLWGEHLSDYQLLQPFPQLQADSYQLPQALQQEQEVGEFKGHMTTAYNVRNLLTRNGYTRSANVDGAWFAAYQRNFPVGKVTAEIEFSGNELPERDRPVALIALRFLQDEQPLPLGEVPPLLLSECRTHLREIAAKGPGFAPDWENLVR